MSGQERLIYNTKLSFSNLQGENDTGDWNSTYKVAANWKTKRKLKIFDGCT